MKGYKRIRVFTDRDLRATRLEMAVIDCHVVQRLRNIKQLGQSSVVYPTAEHSRFSHALGALYWSSKMVSYLKENFFSRGAGRNEEVLENAETALRSTILRGYQVPFSYECEMPWFEQLIRLAALLHDVTHIPFGHTLEDQAGLLSRHDEDAHRIKMVFERLETELEGSPHLRGPHGAKLLEVLKILLRQVALLPGLKLRLEEIEEDQEKRKEVAKKELDTEKESNPIFSYLTLVNDIVNNTICADLIDYLQRDSLACGMPWFLDKALLSHLKILEKPNAPEVFRLGVGVVRKGKLRHDVVTAVLGLLRARYDVTEKVYYHHTKCAADAMLEKAIRIADSITPNNELPFVNWEKMFDKNLGDEGFINLLSERLEASPKGQAVLNGLLSRHFYKAVFRIRGRNHGRSAKTENVITQCQTAMGRSQMENEIAEKCGLDPNDIIVSCLPENMQLKEAEALVEWSDGEVLMLSQLPDRKYYLPEVKSLRDRYLDLWSLSVYLAPEKIVTHIAAVQSRCETAFAHRNDSLTEDYSRANYPFMYEVQDLSREISAQAEIGTIEQLGVAFGGGEPQTDHDVKEVFLDQLATIVGEKRENDKNLKEISIKTNKLRKSENQSKENDTSSQPGLLDDRSTTRDE